jgi:hypothetical protein
MFRMVNGSNCDGEKIAAWSCAAIVLTEDYFP